MRIKYRGFWIELDKKPIPIRIFDWDFWSDDSEYSGAAASEADCRDAIDDAIDEMSENDI